MNYPTQARQQTMKTLTEDEQQTLAFKLTKMLLGSDAEDLDLSGEQGFEVAVMTIAMVAKGVHLQGKKEITNVFGTESDDVYKITVEQVEQ